MPTPTLTAREQKLLLEDRIYWRLYNVHYCKVVAGLIRPGSYKNPAALVVGDDHVTFDSFKEVAWPALDIGIITGRVLMQFLGIYYACNATAGDHYAIRSASHATDVTIVDFGLPLARLDPATKQPRGIGARAANALLKMLRAGNQGIGHLTRFKTRTMSLTEVVHGCEAVQMLLNQELYVPLGHPAVTFPSPRLQSTKASPGS